MKTNVLNMFKVSNKGARTICVTLSCPGVFIVNFRGMGIEDPVKHLQWSFISKNS